ncbi:MAG: UbiD family decarboxylase, partial [Acetobacteraceae bacterium]
MREYMEKLRAAGQLLEVHREVSPKHELAAVTQAAQRHSGKAILFHRVTGSTLPVVSNIYGSRQRLAEILGIGPYDFCRQWNNLVNLAPPIANPVRAVASSGYELVECRVSDLPLITYAEHDGAPYFTSAMFLATEPETGVSNLSFHRSMYVSDGELRCRLAPRHHLTLYHEKAERMGRPLEAAMLIGPPPTTFLSAAAPIPYDADEMELAAKLARRPLAMRPCRHIDLMVPDATEIVI